MTQWPRDSLSARHRRVRIAVVVPLLLLHLVGPSRAARSEEASVSDETAVALAEQRGAQAFEAYQKGEYASAVALYLEAYRAAPSGSILYNIARIYDLKLEDRLLAMVFYRRYIADPGAFTERLELANQRLRELRAAEAMAPPPSPRRPEPVADPAPADTGPGRDPPPRGRLSEGRVDGRGGWVTARSAGVAMGAAGLVGLGIGVGFGLGARAEASTANDLCDGNACSSARGVDAAHTARREATISNIGFGVGGALLLTGATLFFVGATEKTPERSARADVRLEPQVTVSEASLRVSARW